MTAADAPHIDLKSGKEFRELLEVYLRENWTGEGKQRRGYVAAAVFAVGLVASSLGAFAVLVPMTYGLGGLALHSQHGWRFWQPGVGGIRFVALNGVGWALYSIALLMTGINVFVGDIMLAMAAFAIGMGSYGAVVSSLLVYRNKAAAATAADEAGGRSVTRAQIAAPPESVLRAEDRTFTEEVELSALMRNGESVSDLWWLFIAMMTVTSAVGAWVGAAGDFHAAKEVTKMFATVTLLWSMALSTAITHAIGGQWRHINTGYLSFQPGKGGPQFVAMQAVGWTLFSLCELIALVALFGQFQRALGRKSAVPASVPLTAFAGLLGWFAQCTVAASLFFYVAAPGELMAAEANPLPTSATLVNQLLKKTHFLGLNLLLNGGTTYENSRALTIKHGDYDAWKRGEERYQEILQRAGVAKTGKQYLLIGGAGFVGRVLIKRLLERGETRVRVFDLSPVNPYEGWAGVEYVRGDVTKYEQVLSAMQGVDVVYSIFAIIRFMDRLEHQAALSYRINVGGTENVLNACRACNVECVVVTSSSHATTDDHSLPRHNRDETAPYVVRETAHNHYGFTKALADIISLCVAPPLGPRARAARRLTRLRLPPPRAAARRTGRRCPTASRSASPSCVRARACSAATTASRSSAPWTSPCSRGSAPRA